ncbi:hypothetical protein B0J11DRAFT_494010 [Dendryphion nanum]|uniref:Uncharacterized protein n=1 Tax=Dendryphion nanum TaxID=256645 RepID=A0A9P9DEX3_9PLEO|nr:hypothetical protein B0J11DRAFT_494010 [Dendryphion nanum]
MLAESGSSCSTACSARKSLARNLLLRNNHTVIDIYTKYFGLCMLYSLSHYTLLSFKRGIERMAMISPHEWDDRLWQMRNVNEEYPLEARIERTLLETGLEALEAWAGAVEVGLGMEDQARTDIALAYGKAGRFLKQACLL